EDSATSHLGVELTRRGLYRTLSRLDRRGRGILTAVQEALGGARDGAELKERVENRVRPAVAKARAAVEGLVERLERSVEEDGAAARLGPQGIGEPVERQDVGESLRATLAAFSGLEREVGGLRARLELDEELTDRLEGRLLDLRSVERRLATATHGLRLVLVPGDEAPLYVRWLEVRGSARRRNLVLAAAPVELGGLLRDSLFSRVETAVLTSATMSTRGGFEFLRSRLGLADLRVDDDRRRVEVRERIIDSPFDFDRQTLLVVPTDMPPIERAGHAFHDRTARLVEDVAATTDGGVFV